MAKKPENIVLKNVDAIILDHPDGDNLYYSFDGLAEFFMDEHDLQWVKFTPRNGYMPLQEHNFPRERIVAIIHKSKQKKKPKKEAVHELHPGLLEQEGK